MLTMKSFLTDKTTQIILFGASTLKEKYSYMPLFSLDVVRECISFSLYDSDIHTLKTAPNVEIIKWLVRNGANIHENGEEALCSAIFRKRIDIVKILVEFGADISIYHYQPLKDACEIGNLNIIKILLENIADVNECEDIIMSHVLYDYDILDLFLQYGLNINDGTYIERIASIYFYHENVRDILELILQYGADFSRFPNLLSNARTVEIARFLLERGAILNRDVALLNVLKFSYDYIESELRAEKCKEAILLCLAYGARVNIPGVLVSAVQSANVTGEMLQMLLERGARESIEMAYSIANILEDSSKASIISRYL